LSLSFSKEKDLVVFKFFKISKIYPVTSKPFFFSKEKEEGLSPPAFGRQGRLRF
jgi:hypothetical protein